MVQQQRDHLLVDLPRLPNDVPRSRERRSPFDSAGSFSAPLVGWSAR